MNEFLTNYNKLDTKARDAMFAGTRYKGMRQDLAKLAKMTAAVKDVDVMMNFSGTAQQNIYMAMLTGGGLVGGSIGGLEGAAQGAALASVLPYTAANLMTSPKFVRWMAKAADIKPTNYKGLSAHLGRLASVAASEPYVKEDIEEFIKVVQQNIQPKEMMRP